MWRDRNLDTNEVGPARSVRGVWIAVFLVAGGTAPIAAQAVLTGRVAGGSTVGPLVGAIIEIRGLNLRASSDSSGAFRITGVRPGEHTVLVRQIGYRPFQRRIRFGPDEEVRVGFQLEQIPVVLDSVTVKADDVTWPNPMMRGFEDRRTLGLGQFMDHRALEERKGQSLEVVLRRMGVRFDRRRSGLVAVESRGASSLSRGSTCAVNILIDGLLVTRNTEMLVQHLPKVHQLAGIEYYRGSAQVPVIFEADGGACGVLVLWTRLRR